MADFIFFGALNDFLPKQTRNCRISYNLKDKPAVKDAIEAIGIPHPEVNVILVNKKPVNFFYSLQQNDLVEVYPVSEDYNWPARYELLSTIPVDIKFVLDVHLGKLAKYLRLLGFDTCYENNFTDKDLANIAAAENRIVLTRDIGLLKQKVIEYGYWLRSQHLENQLAEVIKHFDLRNKFTPFTRCLACNGEIIEVPKDFVLAELPPKTRLYFNRFYQCTKCKKVYWEGSHFERMLETVEKLLKNNRQVF